MVDEDTLQRFALRARRIAAHSLAADRDRLAAMTNPTMTGSLTADGWATLRRELPDEETFESLAARVRPVLLSSESVHHQEVLAALKSVLDQPASSTDDLDAIQAEVQRLCDAWSRLDESKPTLRRYSLQRVKVDDPESAVRASDAQLALAWLYGDLVHVDVRGKKIEGTRFPLKDRYAAAVHYFSEAALLCVQTFDVITHLHHLGLLELGDDVMDAPVIVGSDELSATGAIFVAPVGTPMPILASSLKGPPEGFHRLTGTEFLRMDPKNHVQVHLETEDGSLIAECDGAVRDKIAEGECLVWRALVADCLVVEVIFNIDDDQITFSDCKIRFPGPTTNRMALNRARLERDLYGCSLMRFTVSGQNLFSFSAPEVTDEDKHVNAIRIDLFEDLVAIENITGNKISYVTGDVTNLERANVRRFRLLWEGHVVPFARGPIAIQAATEVMPKCIAIPAGTQTCAGVEYPTPQFMISHPKMTAENIEPVPDSDPQRDSMQLTAPNNEPFVAWVPDRASVESNHDLLQPTSWGLSHFDSSILLGQHWVEGQQLTM